MTDTASIPAVAPAARPPRTRSEWSGVIALMVAIFTLVTSEFLPASLLPLMATEFGITEGVAGQVVTATALVGAVAGLGMGLLFPRLDRRSLLIGLLALAVLANLVTAIAPNYAIVVVARLVLGAAIAGTWAMAPAIVSHLVQPSQFGRAMSVINIGVAGATVGAIPLGALISSVAGWRFVFVIVAAAAVVALILFLVTMPSIPVAFGGGLATLLAALRSRVLVIGLVGLGLIAAGHFGSYTFIRSAAEVVPGLTPAIFALLLVVFGVGGLIGNSLVGIIVDKHLTVAMTVVPLLMGLSIIGFSVASGSVALIFVAVGLWGLGFGGNPTMNQTWVARAEPKRIEAAGGLFVATFQLAIALGAAVGGSLLDLVGSQLVFVACGLAVLVGGALLLSTQRALLRGPGHQSSIFRSNAQEK